VGDGLTAAAGEESPQSFHDLAVSGNPTANTAKAMPETIDDMAGVVALKLREC